MLSYVALYFTHNEWQVIMISISSEYLATWHIISEHFY